MDRSEIMEIRKLFKTYKNESCPANGFSGAFISPEGEIKGSFGVKDFHDKETDVKKRVFTFASKTISNNAVTMAIKDGDRDLLEKINVTHGSNKELTEELSSRIAKAVSEQSKDNAYAVHVLSYTYDAPAKTSDHNVIFDGSSDVIYTFFVCMICPVVTSKASYGYIADDEEFAMNPLLRSVDNPVCGFVYPDFSGREPDLDHILYFRTEKLDIAESLFGVEAPPLPEKPKRKKKEEPLSAVELGVEEDAKEDAPASAPEKEFIKHDPNKDIPSLNSGSLSMEEVHGRDIAAERHENETEAERERLRKEDKEDEEKPVIAPKKGKKVRITGETGKLKRQMIDGVMCLIVPVADADID